MIRSIYVLVVGISVVASVATGTVLYNNDFIGSDSVDALDISRGAELVQHLPNHSLGGRSSDMLQITHTQSSGWLSVLGYPPLTQKVTSAVMEYSVYFPADDWQFRLQGKLPGLQPDQPHFGGNANDPVEWNKWSVRLMWLSTTGNIESGNDNKARPSVYIYDQDRIQGNTGKHHKVDGYFFEKDTWYDIRIEVQLNTHTGAIANRDGVVELFINGVLEKTVSGLKLVGDIPTGQSFDKAKISKIAFHNYYGGNKNDARNVPTTATSQCFFDYVRVESVESPEPPDHYLINNNFTTAEGFVENATITDKDGWVTVNGEPFWHAVDTAGAGRISCTNGVPGAPSGSNDVRASRPLGIGWSGTAGNRVEIRVDFSVLGPVSDLTANADLFSIGLLQSEQVTSGGPQGIRLRWSDDGDSGHFNAVGRSGGASAGFPVLHDSESGLSSSTVYIRVSRDINAADVVNVSYSFDNFVTSETAVITSGNLYGASTLYCQLTSEDAVARGAEGIAIDKITVTTGSPLLPPRLEFGFVGESVELSWSSNGDFKVQACTNLVEGGWSDLPGATNSPALVTPVKQVEFYQLIQQ